VLTSSKLFTTNPCFFMTGRTCAARARSNCRASSCFSGSSGSDAMKLIWEFGFDSFSLNLACTIVNDHEPSQDNISHVTKINFLRPFPRNLAE